MAAGMQVMQGLICRLIPGVLKNCGCLEAEKWTDSVSFRHDSDTCVGAGVGKRETRESCYSPHVVTVA